MESREDCSETCLHNRFIEHRLPTVVCNIYGLPLANTWNMKVTSPILIVASLAIWIKLVHERQLVVGETSKFILVPRSEYTVLLIPSSIIHMYSVKQIDYYIMASLSWELM